MEKLDFASVTTRGGDQGQSSLANGERRSKSESVFEALGDLDELSSLLGMLKLQWSGQADEAAQAERIRALQLNLKWVMAIVADPRPAEAGGRAEQFEAPLAAALADLEAWESEALAGIEFRHFTVAGAGQLPAWCDLARTVCRRAERHLVRYVHESCTDRLKSGLALVNRLSDYLWALGRRAARSQGLDET